MDSDVRGEQVQQGSKGRGKSPKRKRNQTKLELLRQKREAKKLGATASKQYSSDDESAKRFHSFVSKPDADSNPHLIGQLRTASGMHRVFAAAVGADRRVYIGGAWYRDGKAGALAWFDLETRRVNGLWKPLATNQAVHLTAAGDGKYIVVSTLLVSDVVTGKPVPETAKLFVFDTQEQKFVRQIASPVRGTSTGLVAAGSGNIVMGLMRDPTRERAFLLYGVDIATSEMIYSRTLAAPPVTKATGQPTLRSGFTLGPDAHVWMMHEGGLLRIAPDLRAIEVRLGLLQLLQHFGQFGRVVDFPILLRREADAGIVCDQGCNGWSAGVMQLKTPNAAKSDGFVVRTDWMPAW